MTEELGKRYKELRRVIGYPKRARFFFDDKEQKIFLDIGTDFTYITVMLRRIPYCIKSFGGRFIFKYPNT